MKKLLIVFFLFVTLFSFSLVVSADAFPNSTCNIIIPGGLKSTSAGDFSVVSYKTNGTVKLNGTASSKLSIPIYNSNLTYSKYRSVFFVLYAGVENVKLSFQDRTNSVSYSSFNSPLVFKVSGTSTINYYITVEVEKGTTYDNLTFTPVFAVFDYEVYPYGTDLDSQTDVYYNEGFAVGKEEGYSEGFTEGKLEGKSEGYELGTAAGYSEGYKEGKGDGYGLGANSGEMVGYIDGYKNGYTNYKISTEYANALKSEYSSGFKEGAASVEAEEKDNALAVLVPMLIIDGILCFSLVIFKLRRRRKNK